MRYITAKECSVISLGRQGEDGVEVVQFPVVVEWEELYGHGAFELLHRRVTDDNPYPVTIDVADGNVNWTVRSADVALVGRGTAELIYVVNGAVAKSAIYATSVLKSIDGTGEFPEPYENRIADLIEASANITVEADRAETAREGAEEAEDRILAMSATATVDNNIGDPSVEVDVNEVEGHKNMDFAFHNLKGEKGDKGDKGDTGATGAKGDKGDKGDQGIQGEQGETGATPDISIGTVTTGAAGTDASAIMTGTPENPVLNLTIPRGDEGEVTEEELQAVANSKAPVIVSTASGAIASFDDGAEDMPLKKLVVNVDPVQDLHGYENPWPAGGGKNLLDWELVSIGGTHYGITFTKNEAEGTLTLSGTLTIDSGSVAPIQYLDYSLSGKGYVFLTEHISGDTLVALNRTYGLRTDTEKAIAIYMTGEAGKTYTETIRVSVYSPPAPAEWTPYSNICPITGHTSANVTRTGKNLIQYPYADNRTTIVGVNVTVHDDGTITFNGTPDGGTMFFNLTTASLNPITLSPGTYTLSNGGITGNSCRITAVKDGGYYTTTDANTGYVAFTLSESGVFNFYISTPNGTSMNNLTVKPQLELGSTATDYEPYQGDTYDITFPSEAGTVYGGTLDVTNGVLTVDRAMVDLGTLTWKRINTQSPHWRFWAIQPGMLQNSTLISTQYVQISASDQWMGSIGVATQIISGAPDVMVSDERYETVEDFKTAMSGVQLVYKLATPITHTLTAQQVLTLLKGENNVWADTGDVEVTYYADSKTYIDDQNALVKALIAPVLDSMVADTALVKNDFRIVNNTLYRATTAIASGATLTVGTNVVATTLAEVIKPLLT